MLIKPVKQQVGKPHHPRRRLALFCIQRGEELDNLIYFFHVNVFFCKKKTGDHCSPEGRLPHWCPVFVQIAPLADQAEQSTILTTKPPGRERQLSPVLSRMRLVTCA